MNPMSNPHLIANPTLDELRAARLDAVEVALFFYRAGTRRHAKDPKRAEYAEAQRYWTTRAYQYHGEILARLDAINGTLTYWMR